MKRIGLILVTVMIAAIGPIYGHKGNPWHGKDFGFAIGLNTVFLQPSAPGVPTTFIYRYPVRGNVFGFLTGQQQMAMVVPDRQLSAGMFRASNVLAMKQGRLYGNRPLEIRFSISESGFYHLLFGPGQEASNLVLEPPEDGTIDIVPEKSGKVSRVVPATSGDVHIITHAQKGMIEFVGWIGVMFPDALDAYRSLRIAQGGLPPLDKSRARSLAQALVSLGRLKQSAVPSVFPDGQYSIPFLGNFNGMGLQNFLTAHLTPGRYSFTYDRAATQLVMNETEKIILQVTSDRAYDDGFGTEKEAIAWGEFEKKSLQPTLNFKVIKTGYYHLMYGPGSGGFLMHLNQDDHLPVSLVSKDNGKVGYLRRLGGFTTVISHPTSQGSQVIPRQVHFPALLVRESEFRNRGIMSRLTVPLQTSVAARLQVLGGEILGLLNLWRLGKAYEIGDEVVFEGLDYGCRQVHVAQQGWEPPLTYALWERINAGENWAPQVIYQINNGVVYLSRQYVAIQGHQSLPGWEPPNVPALWQPVNQ